MLAGIVAWGFLVLSVAYLIKLLVHRVAMVGWYGGARYQSCRAVTRLLGLKAGRILWLEAFGWGWFGIGAVMLADHLQRDAEALRNLGDIWPATVALGVGCVLLYGQSRPAAVLLLGASVPGAIGLHRAMYHALFPHRSVSLLESGDPDTDVEIVPGQCFRISFGDWKDAVWRLARSALVIVVDARAMTGPVHEELEFIVAEQLEFKTILLIGSRMPVEDVRLSGCRVERSEAACLESVVAALANAPDSLPSDDRPLRLAHRLPPRRGPYQ